VVRRGHDADTGDEPAADGGSPAAASAGTEGELVRAAFSGNGQYARAGHLRGGAPGPGAVSAVYRAVGHGQRARNVHGNFQPHFDIADLAESSDKTGRNGAILHPARRGGSGGTEPDAGRNRISGPSGAESALRGQP